MKHWIKWLLLAALLQLAGCVTPRKMALFQGMEYDVRYEATPPEEIKLQPLDRMEILVTSENPQLAAPFNASLNYEESASAQVRRTVPYEVDRDGCIDFPKIGPVNVVGLTTRELGDLLAEEMKTRGYIKDASVKVTLENFEVTVVGEKNQIVSVNGGMNLLQLLARAGGPDIRFRMDDVMVVRTENGSRMAYKVDLRKKEVFDSPVFYLRQNDIVYFKPRNVIRDPNLAVLTGLISPVLSGVSAITSVLILLNLRR